MLLCCYYAALTVCWDVLTNIGVCPTRHDTHHRLTLAIWSRCGSNGADPQRRYILIQGFAPLMSIDIYAGIYADTIG